MHELSTCKRLIKQVEQFVEDHQQLQTAGNISNIQLLIGELARVDVSELKELFPFAARGTLAEHAQLSISHQPIQIHCLRCDMDSDVSADDLRCPLCLAETTRLIAGTDMLLTGIEYET